MTAEKASGLISELFFEIRYRANSKMLDHRGEWAESIALEFDCPQWRISENRIDVLSKDTHRNIFLGHKNCGFIFFLPQNVEQFMEHADQSIRHLFKLPGFDSPLSTTRVGVRSKFVTPFPGSFEQLRKLYLANYLDLTDIAKKTLNATLVDIGGPINFTDKTGSFNTMSGPMRRQQMPNFFDRM